MSGTKPVPEPPFEVVLEFLRRLSQTISPGDPVLVLRGSVLMQLWFGPRARPAADIDLECFERPGRDHDPRFGGSPVAHARALCIFASQECWDPRQGPGTSSRFEFDPIDPEDGTDLWDYGTPGERCYTLWVAHDLKDAKGRLQIDLAQAGSYDFSAIDVEELDWTTSASTPFRFPAYTPEMLLAAKLSWIIRLWNRRVESGGELSTRWNGAAKDLFDAHLLLTKPNLRTNQLQNALFAVGAEDKLDWLQFEYLLDASTWIRDVDFPNWEDFRRQHKSIIDCGPAEMLRTVADRLQLILGDFREHLPFLRALQPKPADEQAYLAYADWLQSRGDHRCELLRFYVERIRQPTNPTLLSLACEMFSGSFVSRNDADHCRRALRNAMNAAPTTWLYQVFGSAEHYRAVKSQLGEVDLNFTS